MGPGGFQGPPPHPSNDKLKEPKPESLREVPSYLARLISKFFFRLFYIFTLVWETKPWILFVMLFMAIFNGVSPVIGAFISAALVNSLVSAFNAASSGLPNEFSKVLFMLVLQFAYIFFVGLIHNINSIISRISGELVVNHVNIKIMNKAREIDLASFDRPDFYEKLENASREAGNRPIQIMNSTLSIMSTLISMVSFITILWAISPFAPFIIIVLSVPSAIINFTYRRKNFLYVRHRSKDRRQLNYYSGLMTNKDMVKEVRIYGLSELFIKRYRETFQKYFAGLRKLFVSEGVWNISISVVMSAVNCLLYLFIAWRVCAGDIKVGDYTLYTGALNSIANGIASFISTTATIYEGTLFIDNMIIFMNEKRTVAPRICSPLRVKRRTGHQIVFENVSFRYPGTERDVLKNININISAGDTVVLVGLNGAGKTTLIKLLTRLYDPTEGRILLDGNDIRDYDVDDLYKIFGIIFQDFGKYAVSVKENIFFGQLDKEAIQQNIEEAARQSDAATFIDALPEKYETPLMRYFEETGIELSIGQWQKLAIARAFYGDADIIILDEPTASLDAIAEQEIYNQFDRLRKDKTTIFVSHRLSSATVASKIIVLENGSVIEEGTHSELMKNGGHYYELFSTQAKRYISQDGGENDSNGETAAVESFLPPDNFRSGRPDGEEKGPREFTGVANASERRGPPPRGDKF